MKEAVRHLDFKFYRLVLTHVVGLCFSACHSPLRGRGDGFLVPNATSKAAHKGESEASGIIKAATGAVENGPCVILK